MFNKWFGKKSEPFFDEGEEARILAAIRSVEKKSSAEVRVHVEASCPNSEPMKRAQKLFGKLKMHQTELRNGILVYLAHEDHHFAILGDEGIDRVLPTDFWRSEADLMRENFAAGRYADGIIAALELVGRHLAQHFPRADDDVNELPDDISYG